MNDIIIKMVESEQELKDAQKVRRKVFQDEQKIDTELDFDGKDYASDHIIAYIENIPTGTARIRYMDDKKESAKIERVAVLKEYRNLKIGNKIMEYLHNFLKEHGVEKAKLESQEHAKGFYEKLGYKQKGEKFEEVGIPHVKMEKNFNLKIK